MKTFCRILVALSLATLPAMVWAAPDGAPAEEGAAAGSSFDGEEEDTDDLFDTPFQTGGGWEEEKRPRTYPWFEHHGHFRFRSNLFWRAHLSTDVLSGDTTMGASGMLPPLTHNFQNNAGGPNSDEWGTVGRGRDDEMLAGANLRFRYEPTFQISPDLRIHAQFDILDNVVMGSTPDFPGALTRVRPDVPFLAFNQSQVPPASGVNAFYDSVRVKQAYGEWRSLIGLLRFGRMSSHWGMGIFMNDGQGLDADFGDYVGRVQWTANFWGVYATAAWDFAAEGPTSAMAGQFYGQPYDLDQADDVNQWVIAVFQRPMTEEELDERRRDLNERRVPVLDWGCYNLFRLQDLDLWTETHFIPGAYRWDEMTFVQRDAWVWMPDVWLRFEWRPAYGRILTLELEAVLAYGAFNASLAPTEGVTAPTTDRRDILQYGGVLRADYTMGGLSFGLETGFASGDESPGLSVVRDSNLTTTTDSGATALRANSRLSNFAFDRDYHVDLLMFRRIIGAVTNAMYFKPWVQYDLFEGDEDSLGARLEIIYARALEPDGTPGRSANYGVELDLRLFYEEQNRFLATVEWGILFPFEAFDFIDTNGTRSSAKWGTVIQARVHWLF